VWDVERRFLLRCELDAAFFHLYGVGRDDVDYIMETFHVVRQDDLAAHGRYRTKEQILRVYDAMQRAVETGVAYETPLEPPPAHGWVPALPPENLAIPKPEPPDRIAMRPEPADLELVAQPAPKPPAPPPAAPPLPGLQQRVTVNGRPGILTRRDKTTKGDMVTVVLDGEEKERKYLTQLADVREA
jgi:hypothetical protein